MAPRSSCSLEPLPEDSASELPAPELQPGTLVTRRRRRRKKAEQPPSHVEIARLQAEVLQLKVNNRKLQALLDHAKEDVKTYFEMAESRSMEVAVARGEIAALEHELEGLRQQSPTHSQGSVLSAMLTSPAQ